MNLAAPRFYRSPDRSRYAEFDPRAKVGFPNDHLCLVKRRIDRAEKQSAVESLGKSGYLSQSVLPLYFGLGDATTIDGIEVDWPRAVCIRTTSGHSYLLLKITTSTM